MGIFFAGGCAVILPQWSPEEFLATVEREKATHAFLVPTMINALLGFEGAAKFDTSSLRSVSYGAAPMSPQRIREAWEYFGPILCQGYGAGETTSVVVALTISDHRHAIEDDDEELLLSCGRPLFEAEVKIVGENLLEVASGEVGE
jgi:acyl-CoA synthetase (AMP-forming)/AMP-acid ligase II